MTSNSEKSARVLIVDDEVAICRIIARTLKRNGFEADMVSTPSELQQTLNNSEYDLVLLDRSLGLVDGRSLLPVVKEHAPQAKILFFTGDLLDASELEGVDGVVQKPINGTALAATIREVLRA